ncbi:MAG TPA: electron transfer flavoprotein subunit beta/FixA family protein [Actinomycetota bacterium]|jgi:electron transfer flavoprotein beta subunit|nr:electron transfer flavoprotein subunit beta/FixA family protein [Actinomycetota bacterium]
MDVLVCVKRVPVTGGRISLTDDEQDIDTRYLGFTVSPHEECAVEEAVRLVETHGGSSTVLTLGPAVAEEQLRDAMAMGANRAVLIEAESPEWDGGATAAAIARAIEDAGVDYDLLLFGNESADAGGYQVGIRVAHLLDLPCVTGVKHLEIWDGTTVARREGPGGFEIYEVPLPAVITVKEGINLPRYPSIPGRLRAKKAPVERLHLDAPQPGLEKVRLRLPQGRDKQVEILGDGAAGVERAVEVLRQIGVMPS